MPAPQIRTTDDLVKLFAQYPGIAQSINRLGGDVDTINTLNQNAGGTDDDVAEQYLAKVKPAGVVLTDLVTLLKTVTAQTGVNGEDANQLFDTADNDAQTLANDWNAEST